MLAIFVCGASGAPFDFDREMHRSRWRYRGSFRSSLDLYRRRQATRPWCFGRQLS